MRRLSALLTLLLLALCVSGFVELRDTFVAASSQLAADVVTSAKVLDGTLVNADVSPSAAIAYTKLDQATLNEQFKNSTASDLLDISSTNKGLWLMGQGASATFIADENSTIHTGTLEGGLTFATDRSYKGLAYSALLNGTSDYINFGDSNDFSFGNGATDSVMTVALLVNITDTATTDILFAKYDATSGSELREYFIQKTGTETITFGMSDESEDVSSSATTNAALSTGWHLIVCTYDGGGGATAANGIFIYVDGAAVAVTASNNASYVSMENTTTSLFFGAITGSAGSPSNFWKSDVALIAIEGSELSPADVWRLWKKVEGVYGL